MSYRNIDIDGANWRFKIGEKFCDIRGPNGESYKPQVHDIKGVTAETLDRGRRKGTTYGMVGPGNIREFILRQPGR
jgi:hypothetical protein